jgi:asparagine synthetase B (glutamine-hydrolysing)
MASLAETLVQVPENLVMSALEGMSQIEVAMGFVFGQGASPVGDTNANTRARSKPAEALADAILPALAKPPCIVAFSGGRDSSLLLAVAVDTARREGLPQPIAFTKRHPKVGESIEDDWQERVVRHLGIADWVRVDFDAELDAIGPLAGHFLSRYGVVWPPMLWTMWPFLRMASGGSLVTGDGGDEMLGPGRSGPVARVVHERDLSLLNFRRCASALAPPPVRKLVLNRRHRLNALHPWLRPDAQAMVRDLLVGLDLSEPLERPASLLWQRGLRSEEIYVRNASRLATAAGVLWVPPLLDRTFLRALGRAGGRLGYPSRTAALRANFSGLLPEDVLSRRSKANFVGAWFTHHTRSFAKAWDGSGIDQDLIDPEALRRELLRDSPSAMTAAAVQAAWLAHGTVVSMPAPSA